MKQTTVTEETLTTINNNESIIFAGRLYQELMSEFPITSNMIFSPLSIQICLSMINTGARGNTKQEIEKYYFQK
jgi:serine protease inhibitor